MKHYLHSTDEVFEHVSSSPAGLTSSEAEKRLAENGENKLKFNQKIGAFIKKLKEYNEHGALTPQEKKRIFLLPYMSQWLETVKKPFIKENTYTEILSVYVKIVVFAPQK